MNDLWKRLNILVPEPQCRTFGNNYNLIIWEDVRPLPTEAALLAVTQEQIDAPELERQARRADLANRRPDQTPVTRAEYNNLLDELGL